MKRAGPRKKFKRRHTGPKPLVRKPMSDPAIYTGTVIIGLFIVLLGAVFTDVRYWPWFMLGYVALVAYLINIFAWQTYRGQRLVNWQQSLARIPLRFVGYGTKEGKPLEAAHDHPETLKAVQVSVAIGIIILAMLAVIAWRLAG
jgi:hypothetical protein